MAKSPHHAAAALTRVSQVGGHAVSAPAREAFENTFVDQVDPDRTLPEAERAKRVEAARRAYFLSLAAKSVASRRRKAVSDQRKSDAETLRQIADEIEATL